MDAFFAKKVEETLTDGSKVYNVILTCKDGYRNYGHDVRKDICIAAVNESAADELINLLGNRSKFGLTTY